MKKLKLVKGNTLDEMHFEFMYNGFIVGGSRVSEKGIKVLRRELSILEKLESISKPCECGKKVMDEEQRELLEGISNIEITDEEFDLLYNYIGAVPWATGKVTRNVIATLDWLKSL